MMMVHYAELNFKFSAIAGNNFYSSTKSSGSIIGGDDIMKYGISGDLFSSKICVKIFSFFVFALFCNQAIAFESQYTEHLSNERLNDEIAKINSEVSLNIRNGAHPLRYTCYPSHDIDCRDIDLGFRIVNSITDLNIAIPVRQFDQKQIIIQDGEIISNFIENENLDFFVEYKSGCQIIRLEDANTDYVIQFNGEDKIRCISSILRCIFINICFEYRYFSLNDLIRIAQINTNNDVAASVKRFLGRSDD